MYVRSIKGKSLSVFAGTLLITMGIPVFTPQVFADPTVPPNVGGEVEVSTAAQLEYIDENQTSYLSSNIALMNSFDLSGYSWVPLGTHTNPFTGQFNGNNNKVVNISAILPTQFVGFFGYSKGDISNIGVAGTFKSTLSNSSVGELVGYQEIGSIKNSFAMGDVEGSGSGGLVGKLAVSNIYDSYATSNVEGSVSGGLVGMQIRGGIYNSYATGNVSESGSGSNIGGLVGRDAYGTITDSYATGNVSGTGSTVYLGGLTGGLVWNGSSAAITSSYYDTNTSGQSGGLGTPETDAQMKLISTYTGWDFTNTWRINPGFNNGYPFLSFEVPPSTAVPSGLESSSVTPNGWLESWAPVVGATGYNVYLNGSKVGNTPQNVYSYQFSSEQPGTTYNVQVASLNAQSQPSTLSSVYSVTTAVYGGGSTPPVNPIVYGGGPVPPYINTIFFTENADVGAPFSDQLMTTGGTQPFTWSVISGELPPGLTLNNQGVISGTPTGLAGQYTFTVQVTDGNKLSSTRQLTITVGGATSYPSITVTSVLPDFAGTAYTQQFSATGGTSPYTWRIEKGTLPNGLVLSPQTGELTGIPTESGVYPVTVEATDANGNMTTQTVTLDVLQPYEREIVWNGQTQNIPAITSNDAGTQTTYMPIWYVMHLLNAMGIQSTWNGQTWSMTTSSTPDYANIQAGMGHTSIYLNGVLVQEVNTKAQNDPSTGNPTTYMPIWYVQQILNRVGLTSTWNGTTWTVTQSSSSH